MNILLTINLCICFSDNRFIKQPITDEVNKEADVHAVTNSSLSKKGQKLLKWEIKSRVIEDNIKDAPDSRFIKKRKWSFKRIFFIFLAVTGTPTMLFFLKQWLKKIQFSSQFSSIKKQPVKLSTEAQQDLNELQQEKSQKSVLKVKENFSVKKSPLKAPFKGGGGSGGGGSGTAINNDAPPGDHGRRETEIQVEHLDPDNREIVAPQIQDTDNPQGGPVIDRGRENERGGVNNDRPQTHEPQIEDKQPDNNPQGGQPNANQQPGDNAGNPQNLAGTQPVNERGDEGGEENPNGGTTTPPQIVTDPINEKTAPPQNQLDNNVGERGNEIGGVNPADAEIGENGHQNAHDETGNMEGNGVNAEMYGLQTHVPQIEDNQPYNLQGPGVQANLEGGGTPPNAGQVNLEGRGTQVEDQQIGVNNEGVNVEVENPLNKRGVGVNRPLETAETDLTHNPPNDGTRNETGDRGDRGDRRDGENAANGVQDNAENRHLQPPRIEVDKVGDATGNDLNNTQEPMANPTNENREEGERAREIERLENERNENETTGGTEEERVNENLQPNRGIEEERIAAARREEAEEERQRQERKEEEEREVLIVENTVFRETIGREEAEERENPEELNNTNRSGNNSDAESILRLIERGSGSDSVAGGEDNLLENIQDGEAVTNDATDTNDETGNLNREEREGDGQGNRGEGREEGEREEENVTDIATDINPPTVRQNPPEEAVNPPTGDGPKETQVRILIEEEEKVKEDDNENDAPGNTENNAGQVNATTPPTDTRTPPQPEAMNGRRVNQPENEDQANENGDRRVEDEGVERAEDESFSGSDQGNEESQIPPIKVNETQVIVQGGPGNTDNLGGGEGNGEQDPPRVDGPQPQETTQVRPGTQRDPANEQQRREIQEPQATVIDRGREEGVDGRETHDGLRRETTGQTGRLDENNRHNLEEGVGGGGKNPNGGTTTPPPTRQRNELPEEHAPQSPEEVREGGEIIENAINNMTINLSNATGNATGNAEVRVRDAEETRPNEDAHAANPTTQEGDGNEAEILEEEGVEIEEANLLIEEANLLIEGAKKLIEEANKLIENGKDANKLIEEANKLIENGKDANKLIEEANELIENANILIEEETGELKNVNEAITVVRTAIENTREEAEKVRLENERLRPKTEERVRQAREEEERKRLETERIEQERREAEKVRLRPKTEERVKLEEENYDKTGNRIGVDINQNKLIINTNVLIINANRLIKESEKNKKKYLSIQEQQQLKQLQETLQNQIEITKTVIKNANIEEIIAANKQLTKEIEVFKKQQKPLWRS